jgi:hypothetical protein
VITLGSARSVLWSSSRPVDTAVLATGEADACDICDMGAKLADFCGFSCRNLSATCCDIGRESHRSTRLIPRPSL